MTQRIKLEGTKRGRLTIGLYDIEHRRYHCRCECGTEVAVMPQQLLQGRTQSCGCIRREKTGMLRRTHGMAKTVTYKVWQSMHARCYIPSATCFDSYGGRGIKVCQRWHVFENFLADMGVRPPGMALDRKDVNGNYEPGNCRWHEKGEMARNQQKTVRFEGKTLWDWEQQLGVSRTALYQRLKKHGTIYLQGG